MKQSISFRKRFLSRPRKLANLPSILVVSFTLMLLVVSTAYAAATLINETGPFWTEPGYQFTVDVTETSNPHNNGTVCITYSVDGGTDQSNPCVCSDCNTGTSIGTWVCSIPSNYNNATIAWDMSAFPGSSCTGSKAQGPTGSFGTGPTAVSLQDTQASTTSSLLITSVIGFLMLTLISIGIFRYRPVMIGKK